VSAPAVASLSCAQCGAAVELRTLDLAQTVVCASCGSILDARDPNLRVLQEFQGRQKYVPLIPLGTRGTLKGEKWEAVGFQVRSIKVDGTSYFWDEYLLYNPFKGFRYLTQYNGHWNDVQTVKAAPDESVNGRQPFVVLHGETFKHFQTATATTEFVLGEFPWQVRVGDRAIVRDFVAPPRMLSEELAEEEITWSLGTYIKPAQVWEGFGLEGSAPKPEGVFANQPSDHMPRASSVAKLFGLFAAALIAFGFFRLATADRAEVYTQTSVFDPSQPAESLAYVTPTFTIGGRRSNLEVVTTAELDNAWAYFDYALVNEATGTTYEFGRDMGFYSGIDSDGRWTEGSTRDRAVLSSIPPGQYFLRVHPQGQPGTASMRYTVRLRRDVPTVVPYLLAFLLLALPPIFWVFRAWSMETARWQESDYAPAASGDDDDE
jgi:hypothetical protein